MGTLWLDIRLALRNLRLRPGFCAAIILVLAIGLGGSTAIFALMKNLFLTPLSVKEPDRLVSLYRTFKSTAGDYSGFYNFSYLNYLDFRDRTRSFASLGLYQWFPMTLSEGLEARPCHRHVCDPQLLRALGGAPPSGQVLSVGRGPGWRQSGNRRLEPRQLATPVRRRPRGHRKAHRRERRPAQGRRRCSRGFQRDRDQHHRRRMVADHVVQAALASRRLLRPTRRLGLQIDRATSERRCHQRREVRDRVHLRPARGAVPERERRLGYTASPLDRYRRGAANAGPFLRLRDEH